MAIDIAKLSPRIAATLLNSTDAGAVATTASVARHLQAGGLAVGDGKRLHLLRYLAWMVARRGDASKAKDTGEDAYAKHKASAAERVRNISRAGRDIGKMPPVANWRRRRKTTRSLRAFCETYGKRVFFIDWSDDHLRVLDTLQKTVEGGGQFALAMPRGSGKTSMVTWAALWAIITGRRRMVVVVGADAKAATQTLDAVRGELETNDLLLDDYPEVCLPLRRLDGIAQRAHGQICLGQRTMIGMTADELVLPTLPREAMERPDEQCKASGAVVRCVGITGRLRGIQARTADGTILRPSLVLLDDPQTDESAKSPSQCDDRERLVSGAILGMAGPGETMAAMATLTVIRPDDLADRLLTPSLHPDWSSERTRLVYEWGDALDLWEQYARLRRDPEKGPSEATRFYKAHREAMDAGTKVAWENRKEAHHLSAIQYAWDLRIDRGEDAFFAEYQNDPQEEQVADSARLSVDEVLDRVCNERRGVVPSEATVLTAGIDVQKDVLYWIVCAWTDGGKGWVVDYGTMPEQPSGLLSLASVSVPLSTLAPGSNAETQMAAACAATFEHLLERDWSVDGGAVARIDAALIDSGWGLHTETIRDACKASGLRVFPAKGVSIGAKSTRGLNDTKRKPGDRVGLHWRSGHPRSMGSTIREYRIDVNFWKSWCLARFRTPAGENGAMLVNGNTPGDMRRHLQLAEQLAAEESIAVEAQGRRVEEWRLRRPGIDNHFLDCLVLASVSASMSGVSVGRHEETDESSVLVLSQIQQARRR